MKVIERFPGGWRRALGSRIDEVDLAAIDRFVGEQRQNHEVYPPDEQVFAAFDLTPFESVLAVILGQDPYYQAGLACGLAFSVPTDLPHDRKRPRALRRILAESEPEQNGEMPVHATLQPWAENGVLLLNTALTVRQGEAGSHGHRWEQFTSAVVDAVAEKPGPIVFLLWGEAAKRNGGRIDRSRHIVITSAHPSARLARSDPNSFRGSRPFSRANEELQQRGAPRIDWGLR